VKSAEELHQALKAHLKKTSSKERAPTKKRWTSTNATARTQAASFKVGD
jgi:hypothetical protein